MQRPQFIERLRCPACDSERAETVFTCGFDEGPVGAFIEQYYKKDPAILTGWLYQLDRCLECRCVYQRWCGDEAFLTELYSSWIEDQTAEPDTFLPWIRILEAPWQSRDAQEILMIAAVLGKAPGEFKTFDYGMGYGLWARIAGILGCDSHGFDLSAACRDYARQHGVKIVEQPAGRAFDLINTEQVVEHLADPRGAVRMLAESLAPGGMLKISVPRGDDMMERLRAADWQAPKTSRRSLNPVQPLEHVNALTYESVRRLGESAGLRRVKISPVKRHAFLARARAIPRSPKELAKALIRPWHRFHDPRNIYVWFAKDA